MDVFKLFRWRSRVKTATPEIAGGAIETLTSHVSDLNAHPEYLKKGAAVPNGNEVNVVTKHEVDPLAHSSGYARRAELLQTYEEYENACSSDLVEVENNYNAEEPQPHIVTAKILNEALANRAGILPTSATEDGGLVYVDDTFHLYPSNKDIGGEATPVYVIHGIVKPLPGSVGSDIIPTYLKEGTITRSSGNVGSATKPVYMTNGMITACSGDLEAYKIPVGGCYIMTKRNHTTPTEALGYGVWEQVHTIGPDEAFIFVRTA